MLTLKGLQEKQKTYPQKLEVAIGVVMQTFNLMEDREGLYLVKPHGKMIADGRKTLIVKAKHYKNFLNKLFYLIEDRVCFGVIKITDIKSLPIEEFRKKYKEHKISELERERWWAGKRVLFAYEFKVIKKFEKPKPVELKPGTQVIIKEVKFLQAPALSIKSRAAGESSFGLSLIFTSPGGKAKVAKKINKLIPEHRIYCEPFAGSAAVFFAKESSEIEILNDLDKEIAFAYRFVKTLTRETLETLKTMDWSVSKAKFKQVMNVKAISEIQRFYKFIYLSAFSYGGTRNRFGYDFKKKYNFDKLLKIKERLRKVNITNWDYKESIRKADSKTTFFYLDPPYPEEWEKVGTTTEAFTEKDMKEMAGILKNLKGKFILSIDSKPEYYGLFRKFKIRKIRFKRTFDSNASSQYELLVMNFEPSQKLSKYADVSPSDDHEKGRPIIWQDVVKHWQKPILLFEEYVQLIGGIPIHKEGSSGDIDVLIRKSPPKNENEDIPLKFRLMRALPKEFRTRLHFVYDVYHGPFTSHVPVYHLALIPVEKMEVHEMQKPDYIACIWAIKKDIGKISKDELIRRHDSLHKLYKVAQTQREKDVIINVHAFIWREMNGRRIDHDKISPGDELDKKGRFPIEEYPPIPKEFLALRNVFTPAFLKPASGFEKFEFADPESLWEKWRERYSPVKPIILNPKWDGFSFNLMKRGDEVKLITEDRRRDRAKILPKIATEVRHLPVKEVNLAAECVWFKGGKALQREEAIRVIVGKETMEKEDVRMYVHDIMWLNEKDVTALPYHSRIKLINRIVRGEHLRITPTKLIKDNKKEYLQWAKKFANIEGSEGIMTKIYDFKYVTKAGETARTREMAKWKESYDIEVEVKKPTHKISTTTGKPISGQFVYHVIVRGSKGEEIPIGKTFSTAIKAKVGDILTIRTARLRGYKDKKGKVIKFSTMFPKVLNKRTDKTKPTPFNELMKITWFPEKYELSKKLRFVAQDHFRGKSSHLDLRFERNDHLEGWTLDDLVKGAIKKPVMSISEGKAISGNPALSKIDWATGNTKKLPSGERQKILTQAKAIQPKVWLIAEGILKPGEVGATKQYPGVMIIKDKGYYEEGTRKPYMYEYFIYGQHLKGIYIFRKLPTAGFRPREERKPFKKPMVWFFWKRKEQIPYMLTSRAIKTKTMPPVGHSWLPKKIENQIPDEMRYWITGLSMDKRFERLKEAQSYVKERHIELSYYRDKKEFLRCV